MASRVLNASSWLQSCRVYRPVLNAAFRSPARTLTDVAPSSNEVKGVREGPKLIEHQSDEVKLSEEDFQRAGEYLEVASERVKAEIGDEPEAITITRDVVYGSKPLAAAIIGQKRRIYRVFVANNITPNLSHPLREIILLMKEKWPEHLYPVPNKLLRPMLQQCQVQSKPEIEGVVAEVDKLYARRLFVKQLLADITIKKGTVFSLPSIIVAAPFIQDMSNLGRIAMVAEYMDVHSLWLNNDYNKKKHINAVASGTSAGAVDRVGLFSVKGNVSDNVLALKKKFRIVGTVCTGTPNAIQHHEFRHDDRPVVLLIGSESSGIPQGVLDVCDDLVTVGGDTAAAEVHLDSLNMATATCILLSHLTEESAHLSPSSSAEGSA